jgi:ubiquitin
VVIPAQLRIQLTAAAVTPPAEHAARRPAGASGAAAADADVRLTRAQRFFPFEGFSGKPRQQATLVQSTTSMSTVYDRRPTELHQVQT